MRIVNFWNRSSDHLSCLRRNAEHQALNRFKPDLLKKGNLGGKMLFLSKSLRNRIEELAPQTPLPGLLRPDRGAFRPRSSGRRSVYASCLRRNAEHQAPFYPYPHMAQQQSQAVQRTSQAVPPKLWAKIRLSRFGNGRFLRKKISYSLITCHTM